MASLVQVVLNVELHTNGFGLGFSTGIAVLSYVCCDEMRCPFMLFRGQEIQGAPKVVIQLLHDLFHLNNHGLDINYRR